MPLNIKPSSGSGSITIAATTGTTTNDTLTLPAATDTITCNAATQTLTNKTLTSPTIGGTPTLNSSLITSSGTVATTSGTSVTVTGIPSWAKRVTITCNGVTKSAGGLAIIQIGSGSLTTTGYVSYGYYTNLSSSQSNTNGFFFQTGTPSTGDVIFGTATLINVGSNTWVYNSSTGLLAGGASPFNILGVGNLALSGALDRISLTTVTGTPTFTGGSMIVFYE